MAVGDIIGQLMQQSMQSHGKPGQVRQRAPMPVFMPPPEIIMEMMGDPFGHHDGFFGDDGLDEDEDPFDMIREIER